MTVLGVSSSRPTRQTLASRAYIQIRDKILKGEIGLGEPLSRRGLAAEMGVSFIPVQEAIQRLEAEGMVESRPRVGTRVRIPTAQDVRDRYIIREALEVQSARLYCEKASSAERKEAAAMAQRLDQMAASRRARKGQPFQFHSLHVRFHMRIAECGGCAPLCTLLERNQVLILNWLFDLAAQSPPPPRWHGDLIKVLNGDDPDAAAHAMHIHIQTGMSEVQDAIAARYGADVSWMQQRIIAAGKESPIVVDNKWRNRRQKRGDALSH